MATIQQTGVIVDSITRNGKYEPFELQVARGLITYHSVVNVFGYQSALTAAVAPTTAPIAVWESNAAYVFPTTAQQMVLASGSASDAGLTITINGLDASYNILSESITFTAGNYTGATTVNSYLRINSIITTSDTTSPGTVNVGLITLKNIAGTVTYAQIAIGVGKSQMSIYTVPNNYSFNLNRANVFTSQAYTVAGNSLYRVFSTNNSTGAALAVIQSPFVGNFSVLREYPFYYPPKTDIQWQVGTNVTSIAVGVNIEGVLVAVDGTL